MGKRKECQRRLGQVDLPFFVEDTLWVDRSDLAALMDTWHQEIQRSIDEIVQHSSFTPSRIALCWCDEDYAYDGGEPLLTLTVYGYRPETDKELAARIKEQQIRAAKSAAKKAATASAKEKKERARLAELKAKYPEEQ